MDPGYEQRLRLAAFDFLDRETARRGDVLPWAILTREFRFEGEAVTLLGQTGIWKPRQLSLPISITTSPTSPYPDELRPDGTLQYAYRGTSPDEPDNVRLREAFHRQVPLIYFFGVEKGEYIATWPVMIVADEPAQLRVQSRSSNRS